jgi:hypothetical protein
MNMTTDERELKPASWPLLFTYKSRVFGKGYIAAIELCGRLLAELEVEGVWLYGVNPGALAVGASNLKDANVDLYKALAAVFTDFAEQSSTFEAFKADVESFFNKTDTESEIEWARGLQRMRMSPTIEAPGGLPVHDGVKTKVFVRVAQQSMDTITPADNSVEDGTPANSQLATAA